MNKIVLFAAMILTSVAEAQNTLNIVPMPAEVKMGKGNSIIQQPIGFIVYDFDEAEENDGVASFKQYLRNTYKLTKFTDGDSHSYGLPFEIHYSILTEKKPDGYYELEINGNGAYIKGTALGKFYAFETLRQMITVNAKKQLVVPNCKIIDYPRFKYRGMHLDACRHFMPVSLIKKYIDYLAAYKFNTFHWHLTDDQGWRIEIKKYPLLTQEGAWRNGTIIGAYPGKGNDSIKYGGFYTQEQIKEVVKYATDRYISIIPEIEMPGHSSAAIAAYPQLSCFPDEDTKYPKECVWVGPVKGKQVQQTWGVFDDLLCPSDYTFNFLQDVLDEVMELFPSQYIHIGGDECPKDAWKRSAFCQQLMKDKGLKDVHELQSYFIQRIEKYINSKGKKIIGWDEILEGGLAANATVMSWRGDAGGIAAAKQHHDVIMTPENPLYLNHSQSKYEDSVTQGGYNSLEAVYNYNPVPKELTAEERKYVLGAQGNVWSEYIDSKTKLEYSIFPRMVALAEVLWTPKEKKDWKNFERRLLAIFERLEKQKINYSRAYFDLEATVFPAENWDGVYWKFNIKDTSCMAIVNKVETYKQPKEIAIFDSAGNMIDKITAKSIEENIGNAYIKSDKVRITKSGEYVVDLVFQTKKRSVSKRQLNVLKQYFYFNKATGKKISLTIPADSKYPGDGAFTLVNGVQNTTGFSKSPEYLGFNGKNCEAIIDLSSTQSFRKLTVHALNQNASWIWRPSTVEVFASDDGNNFTLLDSTDVYMKRQNATGTMTVSFNAVSARYVKVLVKNWGVIPAGNSGAGNPAWLFVDEIEVD